MTPVQVAPAEAAPAPAEARPLTRTVRGAARRARFWIIAGVAALVIAVIASFLAGAGSSLQPALSAESSTPTGSRAVAEVLRQQGVTVVVADSLVEARTAAARAPDATLFLYDANGYLDAGQLRGLGGLTRRMVVADPDFLTLQTLAPGVGFGGHASSRPPGAGCDLPAARRAGTLSAGGGTLRPGDAPAGTARTGCFPGRDGTFSVIAQTTDDRTLTLVAPTAVFDNEHITSEGNAALALGLLGASATLIWYLPALADVAHAEPPSIGQLTPGWVTPALLLLVLVAIAAAIASGRRFGPLVAENLPVTVKAGETMEGRARLYARSSARLRAIDTLRVGTVSRLAARLGLPRTAGVDDIARHAAALCGLPLAEVRAILLDAVPAGDRDLVALSDRLAALEREVHERLEPGRGEASAAPADAPTRPDTEE